MRWKKKGRIFDPTSFTLPNDCKEFAQAPQVLQFESHIRVYFSTRKKESNGMYLSHIAFVDFTNDFSSIIRVSDQTVIPLGDMGCYDEHGIFPLNVLRANGKLIGYISGLNRRNSVSIDSAIGACISNDNGNTFQRLGSGPVVCSSLSEPFLICDPFVQYNEGKYHMLYVYGQKWLRNNSSDILDRVYKIGYASSTDGINWIKAGRQIIEDIIDENECQALPTYVKIDNTYHMFFCYRHSKGFRNEFKKAYRIGYATSTDLLNWTRTDNKVGITVSDSGWDSQMLCYPHVFESQGKIYMLYNGNEFGRFGFGLAELIDIN